MSATDQAETAEAHRPLSRFRVLELTVARAGPSAGRTLADWGAEVIKIEPPAAIAEADVMGKRNNSDRMNLNRNKDSLSLNLKTEEGREIFFELAKTADVIIENMRADVKHRLGIDYESIRRINPRIVYGSISGFGQTGPYKARAGVDQIAQGMGGLMSVTGLPGQGPVRAGVALVDLSAGAFVVQGILMALLEREVTGTGRWVQTSLLESMIWMLDFQAARWLVDGEVAQQSGNNHPTGIPSGLFPTSDGQIQIAATGDKLFSRFCKLAEAEHLLNDPDYASPQARLQNRDALNDAIAALTRTRTSREWTDLLADGGVPCGPVNSVDLVFDDPQVQHLNMVLETPTHDRGTVPLVAPPMQIDGRARAAQKAPPELGEQTDRLLAEIGFDNDRIAALRERGIV